MIIPLSSAAVSVASLIVAALIGAIINHWICFKPKVICYINQTASFKVKEGVSNPFDITMHSLVLKNTGRCVAKEIQVIHGILPNYFEVSPGIEWKKQVLENEAISITFPTLLPSEQVTISYMYPPNIQSQIHTGVRHQDGLVKFFQLKLTLHLLIGYGFFLLF